MSIGTLGIIVANLLLISVRAFASHTGLEVHWLSRSYARERAHLRKLTLSTDIGIAWKARRYLRIEVLGWTVGILSIVMALWGVINR